MLQRKHIYIGIVIIFLSFFGVYNYMYKDHKNIAVEKPDFKIESNSLGKEFLQNIDKTTTKYLDKILQVSGTVTEIEKDNFTLNKVLLCYSDTLIIKKIKIGDGIVVKGRSIVN